MEILVLGLFTLHLQSSASFEEDKMYQDHRRSGSFVSLSCWPYSSRQLMTSSCSIWFSSFIPISTRSVVFWQWIYPFVIQFYDPRDLHLPRRDTFIACSCYLVLFPTPTHESLLFWKLASKSVTLSIQNNGSIWKIGRILFIINWSLKFWVQSAKEQRSKTFPAAFYDHNNSADEYVHLSTKLACLFYKKFFYFSDTNCLNSILFVLMMMRQKL